MGKCSAMTGFSRCTFNVMWTVTVLSEQIDTCGVHLDDAFKYACQLGNNAVDKDLTLTLHYNDG